MKNRSLPSFENSWREAGDLLAQKSNRLKLIEALLFFTMFGIFVALLESTCFQIAESLVKSNAAKTIILLCAKLLTWLLLIFVGAPLLMGLFGMAARMANGEDVFLAELFAPFSGKKAYGGALQQALPLVWKILVFWAIPSFLFRLVWGLFSKNLLVAFVGGVILFLLVTAWLLLALRGFVRLFFLLRERMSCRRSRLATGELAGTSFLGGGFWWMCCLPRILLGLLTVGILLIADVIPRMLLSYFLYAGSLTDFVIPMEVLNDE